MVKWKKGTSCVSLCFTKKPPPLGLTKLHWLAIEGLEGTRVATPSLVDTLPIDDMQNQHENQDISIKLSGKIPYIYIACVYIKTHKNQMTKMAP